MVNTIKETWLRTKSTKFKIWLIVAAILLIVYPTIGLILSGAILTLLLIHLISELFDYNKVYLSRKKYFPKGLIVKYNSEGFQKEDYFKYTWGHIKWNDITIVYDNKVISSLSLYNRNTGGYHLFFNSIGNEEEFGMFRNYVLHKIEKVV